MLSVVHNLHLKIYVIHSSVGIGIFLYLHTIPWIMEQSFIIFMKDNITVKLEFMAVSWPATTRNSSLLLMVSQALKFDSSFEGILGLGVPNLTVNTGPHGGTHRQKRHKKPMGCFFFMTFLWYLIFFLHSFFSEALYYLPSYICVGEGVLQSWIPGGSRIGQIIQEFLGAPHRCDYRGSPWITVDFRPQMLTSFLEEAKVKRFSLCFNSGADGVLIAAMIRWMMIQEPTHSEELIDSDRLW